MFLELARRRGDYGIVGLAAIAKNTQGTLSDVRLAFLGAGQTPVLARKAMAAVEGKHLSPPVIAASAQALADDLDPGSDINESGISIRLRFRRTELGAPGAGWRAARSRRAPRMEGATLMND